MIRIRSNILEESKKTLNRLLLGILLYAVPFVIFGIFVLDSGFSYFIGLILGCIIAVAMAIHLYRSLDYCLELDPESAEKAMKKKTMLRFIIMLLAIGLSFCFPRIIDPIGLFLGMMGLKVSAYIEPFIHR